MKKIKQQISVYLVILGSCLIIIGPSLFFGLLFLKIFFVIPFFGGPVTLSVVSGLWILFLGLVVFGSSIFLNVPRDMEVQDG